MTAQDVMQIFDELLKQRGISYTPDSNLVRDLQMDSVEVLGFIVELEEKLEKELEADSYVMIVEKSISEVAAALANVAA